MLRKHWEVILILAQLTIILICYTNKFMCLLSDGHVDDFTGTVRLGHPVPGDDWTLFCTG